MNIKIDPSGMSSAQQKFLLDQVQNFAWHRVKDPACKLPEKVLRAQRVIVKFQRVVDAYDRGERKRRDRRQSSYNKLVTAARDAIYFGMPKEARVAVEKLARWCASYSSGRLEGPKR